MRDEINKIRDYVINKKRPGGRLVAQRLMNLKIRQEINKTIAEASISELEKVWMRLRKDYLTN